LKTGDLAGKICTIIDLVTRLPIEVWFHTNPAASETNFEAALLNLLTAKENQDLGVVKALRKPVSKLDLSPFPAPS
jgi:hypothetical protein